MNEFFFFLREWWFWEIFAILAIFKDAISINFSLVE